MMNNEKKTPTFASAFFLISSDKLDQVRELLAQEPAPYTPLERECLQAWMTCKTALSAEDLNENERKAQWVEAFTLLRIDAFEGTVRRHRPWALWVLGTIIASLGCPSVEPFSEALHLLEERRMNIPWLRIQILADLGQTLLSLRSPRAALVQYEQALEWHQRLFSQEESVHQALPAIFVGLCEAACQMDDVEQALDYGKQALAIGSPEQKRYTLSLLGRLYQRHHQFAEASAAYQEALTFAQNATQRLENLVALVRCALAEPHLSVAVRYCDLAMDEDSEALAPQLRASLFRVCGDVSRLQATFQSDLLIAQLLQEQSVEWYCQALAVVPGDPDVLGVLTQLLLEMVKRDSQVSLAAFWMKAYHVVMSSHA